jgi:hypothetical protein
MVDFHKKKDHGKETDRFKHAQAMAMVHFIEVFRLMCEQHKAICEDDPCLFTQGAVAQLLVSVGFTSDDDLKVLKQEILDELKEAGNG